MRYETAASRRPGHPDTTFDTLARGLGWFSLALGAAELLAPRGLTRSLGQSGYEPVAVTYGAREIATGLGILLSKDPTPWVWGRVAGDALDIATLTAGLAGRRSKNEAILGALVAVIGVTALDLYCARGLSRESRRPLPPARDYSDRSGFPRGPRAMSGGARDAETPRDMRTPEALRPFTAANR
jgi:hypothetical protein